ncbi:hypothetical protein SAMD00019534_094210 [Acytostelium subglobosum LB1]|uniref:hypothetical protein n=1 Tax=Acytostelium subglobosum LB1 TaxID=1410327 RepID=UPI00064516AE|nr:hypothetical protein SAMD00019534_094210 [Acytostelium subglobosum LB1]GAM26246.1 hypothetical protein SAMD00019534_094210 [Acytostelium subglobosum LB1]|eukprot:XP_012750800.1 hypothetical protein SAMD00019534_094210 [Acytostelium subglobosum LB1]
MSQATNKYYPPDWDPKKGSVNKFVGKHPLGQRARKIDQGILVVRFEMPFPGGAWCLKCDNHIGRGVRYNAEKKSVGKYLSSTIHSFRMKCHLCDNRFEIHTDPEHTDFKIVSGLRRREEAGEEEEDDGAVIRVRSAEEKELLKTDPIFRLQERKKDAEQGKQMTSMLSDLYKVTNSRSKDDYQLSSLLRKGFREDKKKDALEKKEREDRGITIDLLPTSHEDIVEASKTSFYGATKRKADQLQSMKNEDVRTSSIFKQSSSSSLSSSSSSSSKLSTSSSSKSTSTLTNDKRKDILLKRSRLDPSLLKHSSSVGSGSPFSTSLFGGSGTTTSTTSTSSSTSK